MNKIIQKALNYLIENPHEPDSSVYAHSGKSGYDYMLLAYTRERILISRGFRNWRKNIREQLKILQKI